MFAHRDASKLTNPHCYNNWNFENLIVVLKKFFFSSLSSIVVVRYIFARYVDVCSEFHAQLFSFRFDWKSFIACWLPFFIHYIARPFLDKDSIWTNEFLEQFLLWLGWMNSAINPFIYAFYNGDFRIAFFRLTFRACYRNQQNNVFKWRRSKSNNAPIGNEQEIPLWMENGESLSLPASFAPSTTYEPSNKILLKL